MKILSISSVASILCIALPVYSQTVTLPTSPAVRVQVPAELIPPNPKLDVVSNGERWPAQHASYEIRVSGLNGASEAHLVDMKPGCGFEVQPHLVGTGLAFQRDGQRNSQDPDAPYTTMTSGQFVVAARIVPPSTPTLAGLAVDTTGSLKISLSAVAGISGDTFPGLVSPTTRPGSDAIRHVDRVSGAFIECIPKARVLWKVRSTGAWQAIDMATGKPRDLTSGTFDIAVTRGTPWMLSRPDRQTVAATWSLADVLEPAMAGLVGTCSGKSETVAGSFPVGVDTVDGDIAFRIRSGPLGTRCAFTLKPIRMPDGATMEEVRVSVSKIGNRCRLGSSATLPSDMIGIAGRLIMGGATQFSLDRMQSQILQPMVIDAAGVRSATGTASWVNPFTFPEAGKTVSWNTWSMPLAGVLECDPTAVNDHEVTLRIDSVTYSSPPGKALR